MSVQFTKLEEKTKEQLVKDLKILRAQLAVFEEERALRKRAEQETDLLKKLILSIGESKDLTSALSVALKSVCETTTWVLGQAWIPSSDGSCLVCSPAWYSTISGLEKFRELSENFKFLPGTGLPGQIWASKRPVWIKDITQDSNFPMSPVALQVSLKAGFGVPIIARDNVIAVIEFFMLEPKDEDVQLISLVSAVASQLGTVISQKQTEEKLKESEDIYESLVETLPQNIFRKDKSGKFTFANKNFCSSLSKPLSEVIGKSDFDFYPVDLACKYTEDDEKVIESGKIFEDTEERRLPNGGSLIVRVLKTPCYDAFGNVTGVQGIFWDITKHKLAQEEYKKIQERFSGIYNYSKDAIGYCSLDGVLLDVNESFLKLTGYLRDELVNNKKYQDITPLEYHKEQEEVVKRILKTEQPEEYEKEYLRKDGTRVPVSLTIFLVKGNDGKPTGVAAVIRDITEHKRTEQELKTLNESLEKHVQERTEELKTKIKAHRQLMDVVKIQEANFRLLFAKIPSPMLVYDLETLQILEANDLLVSRYGYTHDELLSMKITDIRPEEDVSKLLEYLKKDRPALRYGGEWRHKLKNGQIINVEIISHTFDFNGRKAVIVVANDITERKKVEKALKESEEKYKKLIASANDAIFLADTESGIIVDANKQAELLLGIPKEKIIGMRQTELHPKEEAERYNKLFKGHIHVGKGISEELFVCNKDGQKIPVEISASVFEIDGRKLIQGIFRDLTRWKQAEETRYKLASIVESSDDAIFSWNLNRCNTSWNRSAERIYGYTKEEIIGKHVSLLVPKDGLHELDEIFENIKNGRHIENYETVRLRKDGKPINVSLTISPLKDASGNVIGLSTIARDITSQKLAEESLNEAKRKLATLIDNLPGIAYRCVNDPNWTMEYLSEGCLELTGYKSEELIGNKVVSYSSLIHKEDRKIVWGLVQDAVSKRKPYVLEYRIITKNGKENWIWEKGSGVYDNGNLQALEGFIIDITERKLLETQLEKIKQQEKKEREIMLLDKLATSPKTDDVITQLFGVIPLQKSVPGIFSNLVKHYGELIDLGIRDDNEKTKHTITEEMQVISEELCVLKAGPSDLMEIHNTVMKSKSKHIPSDKAEMYTEKARIMLLELMSYLISYYRRNTLISKENPFPRAPIRVQEGG